MSDGSRIEWTEATWNPVTGCTKVSQGCKHCYAERDWKRLSANPLQPAYHGRAFTDVRCHPERLQVPVLWSRPRRVFVNSMSDLFHEDVPFEFIDQVFAVMSITPRHTYQVLTKRPTRMLEYLTGEDLRGHVRGVHGDTTYSRASRGFAIHVNVTNHFDPSTAAYWTDYRKNWPMPNVWLGVSVEDQATANERIPPLLQAPAAVRFVSAEPLLARIDLRAIENAATGETWDALDRTEAADAAQEGACAAVLDWVIAGGESGPAARPMDLSWVRDFRDQCAAAGTPFFFKQWGEWLPVDLEPDTGEGTAVHPVDESIQLPENRVFQLLRYTGDGAPYDAFARVGKRVAGRTLDGRTHDAFPHREPWPA